MRFAKRACIQRDIYGNIFLFDPVYFHNYYIVFSYHFFLISCGVLELGALRSKHQRDQSRRAVPVFGND